MYIADNAAVKTGYRPSVVDFVTCYLIVVNGLV